MTATTAMLPGLYYRESEFQGGLTGACGPNALSMAASWATQHPVSTLSVYYAMRAHNLCDPNGPSTIGGLRAALPLIGLAPVAITDTARYRAYAEPWGYAAFKTWMLAQLAAGNAVVIEVANGQALVDALTGKGENARNLRYHFFTVVGYVSGRWVCLDGDNLAVGNVAQHYTDAVMSAAKPCAALAIASIRKAKSMIDESHLGTDVRDWLAAHPQPATYETLLAEWPVPGATDGSTINVFGDSSSDHVAFWDGTHKCVRLGEWDGHLIIGLRSDLSAAEAEVAALRQQLATAQAALTKAESDLAAAKSAPTPEPPTPAPDPAAAKALALVAAIRAAVAA